MIHGEPSAAGATEATAGDEDADTAVVTTEAAFKDGKSRSGTRHYTGTNRRVTEIFGRRDGTFSVPRTRPARNVSGP